MAKVKDPAYLRRKEKVRATTDLPGVPEGTMGKVMLSVGLDWLRYWVRFDNGVELGSIHRDHLVRAADWDDYLIRREQEAEQAAALAATGGTGATAADDTPADSGGAAETVVNGIAIPPYLIERSRAARQRLGG